MIKLKFNLAFLLGLTMLVAMPHHRGAIAVAAAPSQSIDRVCQNRNFNALAQALVPDNAEPPLDLPSLTPLETPQRPQAVAIQQTLSLTLPAAIRLAFDRNPDLQVTKLQLQRSCAQLKGALAANLPTLQVNGSISRTDYGNVPAANVSLPFANRIYPTITGSQVQSQTTSFLQQQQSTEQRRFQQQLQQLQQRFQQTATLVQRDTLQQQLQQLQQQATANANLSSPVDIALLTPSDVSLPLRSSNSVGDPGGYFNSALSLNYAFFTGGRRSASIQIARKQVDNAVLAIQNQLQQLRLDVANNYYDLQQTRSLIGVADSTVKNAQENLRVIQAGEQAGIRTRYEVLQASVSLADALQNQSQAKALLAIARRQIGAQLNLPDTVDITLPDTTQAEPAGTWQPTLEDSLVLALNHRLELNQTLLQREITQLQQRVVRSQKQPQVQGFAQIALADDLEDRFLGAYGYSLGVQMSLNAFDGGAVRSQLKQLDRAIETLDQQFNQLKESIRFEVEQAYFNLKANASNLETAKQALTEAQESLRLAQLRLSAGVGTTLEVTRAQADLTQAQGNLVAAILDYNRALAQLQRSTGYAQPQ